MIGFGGGHRPFRLQVVRLYRHGTSICVIPRRFVSEHSLKSGTDTRREVVTGPSAAGLVFAPLCREEQEEQSLTMTLSRLLLNRLSESEWEDWTPLWYHEGSKSFSRTCAQSPTACRSPEKIKMAGLPLAPLLTDVNKSEDGLVLCWLHVTFHSVKKSQKVSV